MGRKLHRYYLQRCLVMHLESIAFHQQIFHQIHVFANDGCAEPVRPLQHPKVGGGVVLKGKAAAGDHVVVPVNGGDDDFGLTLLNDFLKMYR
ncbi:MAG: hypothetical protein H6577_15585 [Lewinellaceae bacterium]|nr:hypothetical protein [Saprospiraceae bacterium]MCB9339552.1 hypothetical protein [Lewinellaceae bacterium]